MNESRRNFLALAGLTPLAVLAVTRAGAQTGTACYDPAALSFADKSRRRSLGYVETAGDDKRRCGRCAFFSATQNTCGTCQLMTGAPVTAASVCNSFAPKA